MNSPLVIAATTLWLVLLWLVLRQGQQWAKKRSKEKVIYQNHPAIPVKVYKLSGFEAEPASKSELVVHRKPRPRPVGSQPTASSTNVWDV